MSRWGIDPEWAKLLEPVGERLDQLLMRRKSDDLPDAALVLRAFTTPPSSVKVVIVGQDPYPTPGHANGLAFSVTPDLQPVPSSLRNIFKELVADLGVAQPSSGDLTPWFKQGVLLLNRTLTVAPHAAGSHQGLGWEIVTEHALQSLVYLNAVPAILWGKSAQDLAGLFPWEVSSPHPSPLSAHRGFFGSRPFSRTNAYLRSVGRTEIEWRLP